MGCKNACMQTREDKNSLDTNNLIDLKIEEPKASLMAEADPNPILNPSDNIEIEYTPPFNPSGLQSALKGYLARKIITPQLETYRSEKFVDVSAIYEKVTQNMTDLENSQIVDFEQNLPVLKLNPLDNENFKKKSPLKLKDGSVYAGEWDRNGNICGVGKMITPSGSKLEGQFKDNALNGVGRLIEPNGLAYQGEFRNGNFEGEGKLFRKNGAKLKGNFREGVLEGNAVEEWPDGVKYQGDYKQGKKHGQGCLITDDGTYTGGFRKDRMHGKGVFEWKNKNRYEGEWKNNRMNGYGEFDWSNGRVYKGYWKNDLRSGEGTMDWNDGRKYTGLWKEGKQDGTGTITTIDKDSNPTSRKGLWEHGNRVEWVD